MRKSATDPYETAPAYRGDWIAIIAFIVCFILRILALRFHGNLPAFSNDKTRPDNKKQDIPVAAPIEWEMQMKSG